MTVHAQFERLLAYGVSMHIKHKVPEMKSRPSGKQCVDRVMKKAKIKVLDIGHIAYNDLVKRAQEQLDALPGKAARKKAPKAKEKKPG